MIQMRSVFFSLCILLSLSASAQDRPIGYWRAHTPYTHLAGMATDGVTLYVATVESFFTYNAAQNELSAYSKVDGMAGVEMSAIAYDKSTDITVLAYKNADIDLFIDGTFYNIPDIRLKSISGIKEINSIYTENGKAYICTSFGIVVLDLVNKETEDTYSFTLEGETVSVMHFAMDESYRYAATTSGLYRTALSNPNPQAFSTWQLIDTHTDIFDLLHHGNALYFAIKDSVFKWDNSSAALYYESPYEITSLNLASDGLYIGEINEAIFKGNIKHVLFNGTVADSIITQDRPLKVVTLSSGEDLYEADGFYGLTKFTNGASQGVIKPQGPSGYGSFDMVPYNKKLWIAHGGYDRNWGYTFKQDGFSLFENEKWISFTPFYIPAMYNTWDHVRIAVDPANNDVYVGSFGFGLLRYANGTVENLTSTSAKFETAIGDPTSHRITGLCFDNQGNLWMNQYGAPHELLVKTKDGQYYNFAGAGSRTSGASVILDDYDQKWYLISGSGVAVYNDNGTIENTADDSYGRIDVSKNLPSNTTYCLAKDKDGTIWIGTADGIGIVNCPGDVISGGCAVEKRIVQYDIAAGYLFQGESVMAIAVDGANRKWIGTINGVWLISENADKIIYRFTTENSPLPSNSIQKIAIDPVTGDVYIGTDLGLVTFRSTATEGTEAASDVLTFPNPVPSGYAGTIAIKGLPNNADVRITDISGQLIYRTKALGGQAVWNGKDYTGRRPQSGVYLIFATNADGTQSYQGKMAFME